MGSDLAESMCIVISECATSAVCVCGIDRRERVCVLLLATPNRFVLDSRYPRERGLPDVREASLQSDLKAKLVC